VSERGIGRGISTIEPGVRLRYEITRKFAPYVGVSWERALGETADLAREEGEDVENLAFLVGLRVWF
jgi:copper resistance protein B